MKLSAPVLMVSCLALAAAELMPERAPAQMTLTPRVIQIDQVKCSDLQAGSDQKQERLLVYFNGYLDGMRRHTVWDERKVGEMVDRALGYCKADPSETLLSAFTRAAR
jgi:HdeA/HdeB family protein